MGNVSRPSRAARPERPSRGTRPMRGERPERSTTFTEDAEDLDFAEDSFEDFADGDEFESTDEFEEFPDDGYEDFSTGNEQDEWEDFDDGDPDTFTEAEVLGALDGPKKVERPVRSERPTRHERPTRPTKQQRPQRPEQHEQDFEDDAEEEKVQVRHRRVREEDVVEDEPQMFSFTTDINKMTVSTMLADVDVNGYDFDDEGNLVRKDTAEQHDEKADTGMQTVESLDELLKNIDSSSVIDTDAELGEEINAGTKNITGESEAVESTAEKPVVAEKSIAAESVSAEEVASALDVISANTDGLLGEEEQTAEPMETVKLVEESAALDEYKEEEEVVTGSILDKLQQAAFKYRENVLNCGIESLSDVMVKYRYDGDYSVKPSNRNTLAMPNCKVYKNGKTGEWTKAQEVRLNTGDRISIDFGVGVVLPKGYGLHAVYNKDLLTKFGLDPVEPQKVFNNMQAATALSLGFIARNSMAYVARFQSLVELEVVKVNEEV